MSQADPPAFAFAVGDWVEKTTGYHFCGFVVAAFETRRGEVRYVVEHEWGWLMIFAEHQLRRATPPGG